MTIGKGIRRGRDRDCYDDHEADGEWTQYDTIEMDVPVFLETKTMRCMRDATSVMARVETNEICELKKRKKGAVQPPPCRTSSDLRGCHPQSALILPIGEPVAHSLLLSVALLPKSDRVAVQGRTGQKEFPKLQDILSRHSFTASVADPEYICDVLVVHTVSVRKHLAADEGIHMVSSGPETGPFPADVANRRLAAPPAIQQIRLCSMVDFSTLNFPRTASRLYLKVAHHV